MMIYEPADKITALVNSRLEELLTPRGGAGMNAGLYEAMRYSALSGGKRMRPLLAMAAFQAVSAMKGSGGENGGFDTALDFACAVEMIHCYSLIHDDLPAMDDDDLRRGKPTNHKVYGEAEAILAGDGLLNKAFEVMAARAAEDPGAARAMLAVSRFAGADGMIGGQAADILSENKPADAAALKYIHINKTAALIRAAVGAGAAIAGAGGAALDGLDTCAASLGLAFQIKDDILDLTSTDGSLGKPVGSDARNKKLTYPAVFGMEQSQADFGRLSAEAMASARAVLGASAGPMEDMIRLLTEREK